MTRDAHPPRENPSALFSSPYPQTNRLAMKPFPSNPRLARLEDIAPRALEFLRCVDARPEVLRLLSQAGYAKKAHEESRRRLASIVSAKGAAWDADLEHLRAMVEKAQATHAPEAPLPAANEARLEAFRALRVWYASWSKTARVVLSRPDHLLRVGLATREGIPVEAPLGAASSASPLDALPDLPLSTRTCSA